MPVIDPSSPALDESSRRPHVLVVEDDADLRDVYAETLKDAGFEVTEASDGARALAAIERSSFDVVLSDVLMPGVTGVELLRRVRERDLDVPVVLVTGNPSVETAIQAVEMGAINYLLKPVGQAELVQSVRSAFRLKQLALAKREALRLLGELGPMTDRAGLEAVFGRALDSLYMLYQPIVRTRDSTVFAWEALLRTREPAVAGPLEFPDLADRPGRATLKVPNAPLRMVGGRRGRHTEYLGRLLAEMQIVARSHPGASW